MSRSPQNLRRPHANRFRLLVRLPFEVDSPRLGKCRLEFREGADPCDPRKVVLVGAEREWVVHTFDTWDNPVAQYAIHERGVDISGPWQVRLFEQLVDERRAERTRS